MFLKTLEKSHKALVHNRRVSTLARSIADILPTNARVLDVGCGDGLLAKTIMLLRPDISIVGIDVFSRQTSHIEVKHFDGAHIPFADAEFEIVMFVDVLHHTEDPLILLREARRVAKKAIVIKDHTQNNFFAGLVLRFMDWVGNVHQGVALVYNYPSKKQWDSFFTGLELKPTHWENRLGLYPFYADWLFGKNLHFISYIPTELKND